MGATISTRNAKSNLKLKKEIDYIATNLILTSDFTDMTKLGNVNYCNKLVKKVSVIFQKNQDIDIGLLIRELYKIKKNNEQQFNDEYGVDTADATDATDATDEKEKKKEPMADVAASVQKEGERKHVGNIEVEVRGGTDKKRKTTTTRSSSRARTRSTQPQSQPRVQLKDVKKKCNKIAEFYVLVAHLFACIVSTINPSFEINSNSTNTKKSTPYGKSLDFCSDRLMSLINNGLTENSDGNFMVNPKICQTNISKSGSAMRIGQLPGMNALKKLFEIKGDHREEIRALYKALMGDDAPSNITTFNQIEGIQLKSSKNDVECSGFQLSSSSSD